MSENAKQGASPESFLEYLIVRVAAQLEARFREALKPEGFTPHSFSTLAVIAANPNSNPAELARMVLLTPQSMGAVIEQLEQKGLLRRQGVRKRGTPTQISLTAAGRRALGSAWKVVGELDALTRKKLGKEYQTALSILGRLSKVMETRDAG